VLQHEAYPAIRPPVDAQNSAIPGATGLSDTPLEPVPSECSTRRSCAPIWNHFLVICVCLQPLLRTTVRGWSNCRTSEDPTVGWSRWQIRQNVQERNTLLSHYINCIIGYDVSLWN